MAALLLVMALSQAQPPVRDTRPVVAGPPAAIAGVVVSDESRPRPLRRARVTIAGGTLQIPRTAITKDDGTFEFGGLTMIHGATRPARPGRPMVLQSGERRSLTMALPP